MSPRPDSHELTRRRFLAATGSLVGALTVGATPNAFAADRSAAVFQTFAAAMAEHPANKLSATKVAGAQTKLDGLSRGDAEMRKRVSHATRILEEKVPSFASLSPEKAAKQLLTLAAPAKPVGVPEPGEDIAAYNERVRTASLAALEKAGDRVVAEDEVTAFHGVAPIACERAATAPSKAELHERTRTAASLGTLLAALEAVFPSPETVTYAIPVAA